MERSAGLATAEATATELVIDGEAGARFAGGRPDIDLTDRVDAQRHRGADQAQPVRLDPARQQPHADQADFGLRRTRDDDALRIAHHDVTQAQRGFPGFVALEHRAADLDTMTAAEPLFDG